MRRAVAVLLCVLGAGPAWAQNGSRAAARRYFEAGEQAYTRGRFDLAIRAYQEAYQRAPLPAIAFSLAQAYRLAYYQDRDIEKLKKARELYQKYLAEAPTGNRRGHATQHLEAIEKILATIQAPAAESASPQPPPLPTLLMVASRTPRAQARIDDEDLADVPFAAAVKPGFHEVHVEAPGHFSADSRWLAVSGRLVVAPVDLEPKPARLVVHAPRGAEVTLDAGSVGVAPLAAPLATSPGEHVVRVTQRGHRSSSQAVRLERGRTAELEIRSLDLSDQRKASHWVLGGAAVLAAAGVTTTVLALAAQHRVQRYDEQVGSARLTEEDRRAREDSLAARNNFRTASYVLFGSALTVGVAGGLLYWFDTPNPDSTPLVHSRSGMRVQASVSPGILGAEWTWRH